jgi:hypothetical protein
MQITQYVVVLVGLVLTAAGYFRKSRNLMLVGTIAVLVGSGLKEMTAGALAGWKAG